MTVPSGLQSGVVETVRALEIGDEPLLTGSVFVCDDGGLRDARMRQKGGFDLSGFAAVAADLDLVVEAPEVLDVAVRVVADDVPVR